MEGRVLRHAADIFAPTLLPGYSIIFNTSFLHVLTVNPVNKFQSASSLSKPVAGPAFLYDYVVPVYL